MQGTQLWRRTSILPGKAEIPVGRHAEAQMQSWPLLIYVLFAFLKCLHPKTITSHIYRKDLSVVSRSSTPVSMAAPGTSHTLALIKTPLGPSWLLIYIASLFLQLNFFPINSLFVCLSPIGCYIVIVMSQVGKEGGTQQSWNQELLAVRQLHFTKVKAKCSPEPSSSSPFKA